MVDKMKIGRVKSKEKKIQTNVLLNELPANRKALNRETVEACSRRSLAPSVAICVPSRSQHENKLSIVLGQFVADYLKTLTRLNP